MDKVKFGGIVKSLRAEHMDFSSGGTWTQKHLAEAADLSEVVIGNIERGEKAKIEGYEIVSLADALKLSSMERVEFFAAATDVEKKSATTDTGQPKPDHSFDELWNILSTIKTPAYLADPLFNLIGVNRNMMTFHGVTDQMLDALTETGLGAHILELIFQEATVLRQSMGREWDAIARSTLNQFRYMALRYRYLERFDTNLSLLHKLPDFSRLWMETRSNPARDFSSQFRHYDYTHTLYGSLNYAATMITTITDHGNLYLVTHMPCNNETLEKFTEIGKESSDGARKVMPWPSFTIA